MSDATLTDPPADLGAGPDWAALDDLAERFALRAEATDRAGSLPEENLAELGAGGWLLLTVPRALGGWGLGIEAAARATNRVARACAATGLIYGMHLIHHGLFGGTRAAWPAAVYARAARSGAPAIGLLNSARVEPELGSPSRGGLPGTVATRVGDGWSITGHKRYTTGGRALGWIAVWARTDENPVRVGQFLVPGNSAGLRFVETWDHLGMRGTESHDLILEDVRVPLDHAVDVRPPAAWAKPDPAQGAWYGLVLGALYLGIAEAARDWLVTYLATRIPTGLGAPLNTVPRIQDEVGRIEALRNAARRTVWSTLREAEETGFGTALADVGLAKMTATRNAIEIVQTAISLIGNPGLTRANPLERHLRDVLCGQIHTPQDDTILRTAGRAALGV
ncbi:acyl-CoA dehydrogenase family protein [Zavarzinia sp. CC-PAN008]|uniref:acyl-CoA dehydrogenase family protein n=1 Tax=Zavarzinia sp. CC-PAN008 TaxID=3243332 RepID=UPI003F749AF3